GAGMKQARARFHEGRSPVYRYGDHLPAHERLLSLLAEALRASMPMGLRACSLTSQRRQRSASTRACSPVKPCDISMKFPRLSSGGSWRARFILAFAGTRGTSIPYSNFRNRLSKRAAEEIAPSRSSTRAASIDAAAVLAWPIASAAVA